MIIETQGKHEYVHVIIIVVVVVVVVIITILLSSVHVKGPKYPMIQSLVG